LRINHLLRRPSPCTRRVPLVALGVRPRRLSNASGLDFGTHAPRARRWEGRALPWIPRRLPACEHRAHLGRRSRVSLVSVRARPSEPSTACPKTPRVPSPSLSDHDTRSAPTQTVRSMPPSIAAERSREPIGRWVLREACRQTRAWQDAGLPPIPNAVNVSSAEFLKTDFVESVQTILKETGLEARYLELELTESVLMDDAKFTAPVLQELKGMGIRLAADDFGTG